MREMMRPTGTSEADSWREKFEARQGSRDCVPPIRTGIRPGRNRQTDRVVPETDRRTGVKGVVASREADRGPGILRGCDPRGGTRPT